MKNYTETRFYFYHTNLSVVEKDTLILEQKTLLGASKQTLPLFAFSPEAKVVKKKLSWVARWLMQIEGILLAGLFVVLVKEPSLLANINIPLALLLLLIFILAPIFYYKITTKSRLCFYSQNGRPIFVLSDRKNDLTQKKMLIEFSRAVRNARVHLDQDNFIKIAQGIEDLEKQNLISKYFAEELQDRLGSLANTSIL